MKKVLGLDLGTTSIGWALVNEAENEAENSSIIKLGVRVNPLTVDELSNFEKGKSITTNADRTLKRSMRRNLQRYKLRRENLIEILKEHGFITDATILSEEGNYTTFETYRLRAMAAVEEVSLEQFGRILLMINKKRGYKSSRKAKSNDEGQLIDGMKVAMDLYENDLTPGEYVYQLLKSGKKYIPEFYRSDLHHELRKIWNFQNQFYPEILNDELFESIQNKAKKVTSAIFYSKHRIYTADNKEKDKRLQAYKWRAESLKQQLTKEELAFVIAEINGQINNSSGYLGAISDRSKELYFNKQTVGQYLMSQLSVNPHTRLKNQVFYRQDYLDEFNKLWENQSKYHPALTDELKSEIRDIVIFYQRRLKSQKGLVSICEFENRLVEVEIDGKKKIKTVGAKVCPKSSPLFQEFKIWQIINNLKVIDKDHVSRPLELEEKEVLAMELSLVEKMKKSEVLKLLYKNPKSLDLNYAEVEGNRTQTALFKAYATIIELSGHKPIDLANLSAKDVLNQVEEVFKALGYNTDILHFNTEFSGKEIEQQASYQLWHLLYSYEGDNSNTGQDSLIQKISEHYGFEPEFAKIIAGVTFQPDYGSLSAKAIRKILSFMKAGHEYSEACALAGYRHSKSSLTAEEIEKKVLKDKLEILPKNSLRNPVVEKILNQMINVVNGVVDNYGKPDEIRIEMARELKKSAKEREDQTKAIAKSTAEHEKIRELLKKEFGFSHVSRNDIIRYKLYTELELNQFKTLYSNQYISREKLFSKEIDIEHIIPQSRLFDDSFSNKTLEYRSVNLEKGNDTAYDFLVKKEDESVLANYLQRIEGLYKQGAISKAKFNKLKMRGADIPDDFINRDLRDTQYIARQARAILEELVRNVLPTTGSVTDRLREDWQLVDVMQELNWDKYDRLGMTEIIENRDGHRIKRIKDWSKRNDHRHHAMDALTIAFTKRSHIQYLNNLNARSDKSGSIYGIEQKELSRDDKGKLKFKPPMQINEFRAEAKRHLEHTLISIKAKNKVVTININKTKAGKTIKLKRQLTPRGQLHLETIYGSIQQYVTKEEKVGSNFDEARIAKVSKESYREALLSRLAEYGNDPKKAFTGKNSLELNPIFLDKLHTVKLPSRVKLVEMETVYTIRKEISPDLKVDKVIDPHIRKKLIERLKENDGDAKKAFSNLEQNPIWLNEEKGISIKRVTITGVSNAISLHEKRDKAGQLVLDSDGNSQAVDFVNTGNNHHVAIYENAEGNLEESVISFMDATQRASLGLPIIDKEFCKSEGWKFLFSMKQNEYFVFPNAETGFNPNEIDLMNPENYAVISPNLYRVQKFTNKDYFFRHHLETNVENNNSLKGVTWIRSGLSGVLNIVKVRINSIGQIVSVGEY